MKVLNAYLSVLTSLIVSKPPFFKLTADRAISHRKKRTEPISFKRTKIDRTRSKIFGEIKSAYPITANCGRSGGQRANITSE